MADSERSAPQLKLFSMVTLADRVWLDLKWWTSMLHLAVNQQARPLVADALRTWWGADGRGTGTGGTREDIGAPSYHDVAEMEVWMGTWSPSMAHYLYNKKELQTLVLSLEAQGAQTLSLSLGLPSSVCDMTLLHVTDNTTVLLCRWQWNISQHNPPRYGAQSEIPRVVLGVPP
jgi:hypothetical protein